MLIKCTTLKNNDQCWPVCKRILVEHINTIYHRKIIPLTTGSGMSMGSKQSTSAEETNSPLADSWGGSSPSPCSPSIMDGQSVSNHLSLTPGMKSGTVITTFSKVNIIVQSITKKIQTRGMQSAVGQSWESNAGIVNECRIGCHVASVSSLGIYYQVWLSVPHTG